jgi:hypothetical protein
MNVALGGRFLGNADRTTKFPVEVLVDYVRVYEKVAATGSPGPAGRGRFRLGSGRVMKGLLVSR